MSYRCKYKCLVEKKVIAAVSNLKSQLKIKGNIHIPNSSYNAYNLLIINNIYNIYNKKE